MDDATSESAVGGGSGTNFERGVSPISGASVSSAADVLAKRRAKKKPTLTKPVTIEGAEQEFESGGRDQAFSDGPVSQSPVRQPDLLSIASNRFNYQDAGVDTKILLSCMERIAEEIKFEVATCFTEVNDKLDVLMTRTRSGIMHEHGSDAKPFVGLSGLATPAQPMASQMDLAPVLTRLQPTRAPAVSASFEQATSPVSAQPTTVTYHSEKHQNGDNPPSPLEKGRSTSSTGLEEEMHEEHTNRVMNKITRNARSRLANQIWEFLEEPAPGSAGYWYGKLMAAVIMASICFAVYHHTDPGNDSHRPKMMTTSTARAVEIAFDGVTALEMLIRFVVCPNYHAFFSDPYNILDGVAGFSPLILRLINQLSTFEDSVALKWQGAVPVFRMLKLLRNFEQFHLLLRAFKVAGEALPVLLFTQAIMVLFFGALIYIAEPRDNIPTLTRSYWFTVISMTTVGYGDAVPETPFGHFIASALVFSGTLYMAIPFGIVGNAFAEVWADRDRLLVMKRTRDRLFQSGYTAEDIPALFALFDLTKTGELSLGEFSKMIRRMNVVLDNERLLKLFQVVDADGGGSIDDKEFVRILFPKHFVRLYGEQDQSTDDEQDQGTTLQ